jgi:riboflavin transporter FmnP
MTEKAIMPTILGLILIVNALLNYFFDFPLFVRIQTTDSEESLRNTMLIIGMCVVFFGQLRK